MNLLDAQRSMRDWLVTESPEAAASLGGAAAPGLAVYLNTYRSQLLACLGETYATVRAWLGDTAFESAAAIHIDRVPPSSWTLDDYARDFPDTLKSRYPQDREIFELASLECTLGEIFTTQDCTPLTPDTSDPDTWAQIDWDQARLNLVPSFRLVPVTTNVAAIWSAIRESRSPPAVEPLAQTSNLLFWRRGFSPNFRSVDAHEAEALRWVARGMAFGALCALLVERCGEEQAPQLAATFLGQWLRDGLILGIH